MDLPPVPCYKIVVSYSSLETCRRREITHVATGEVTTLEHELGDDAVEGRALVAEAVLAGAKLQEVTGGLGDSIVVELEVDLGLLVCCGLVSP